MEKQDEKENRTDCLELRQFREEDGKMLHEMFSDPEVVEFTTKIPFTDWQAWRYLATDIDHWRMRGFGPYAVSLKNQAVK